MSNIGIKICGVQEASLLPQLATLGVNYVGLIFHPASKRHVSITLAKEIAEVASLNGIDPVAIFVDQNAAEMQTICEETKISIIQLHGKQAKFSQQLLSAKYQRWYALSVDQSGELLIDEGIKTLVAARDILLIDYHKAGSGKTFAWEKFKYSLSFPWFLAGGLSAENVLQAIKILKPNGVDVSTHVEGAKGQKSISLITKFVKATRVHL